MTRVIDNYASGSHRLKIFFIIEFEFILNGIFKVFPINVITESRSLTINDTEILGFGIQDFHEIPQTNEVSHQAVKLCSLILILYLELLFIFLP